MVSRARLMPALAAAQAAQATATIHGQVTDESGATLPGVTVTLRSPALQVPSMSTTTDERGEYRLTPLPIGIYSVEYELSGFQTLRSNDIRLSAGFSAKLDQSMKIGALAETVTVSGQTPLVDVTQASTATTSGNRSPRADPLRDERHRGLPGLRSGCAEQHRGGRVGDHRHEYFHLQRTRRASCGRSSKVSLRPRVRPVRAARTTTSMRSKRRGSKRAQTAPTRRSAA